MSMKSKQRLALVLAALLLFSFSAAHAGGSAIEEAMERTGTILVKQFTASGQVTTVPGGYPVVLDTASVTDRGSGEEFRGVRLTHRYYDAEAGLLLSVAYLDESEVSEVIAALSYARDNLSSMSDYTEIRYKTAGGAVFGAYLSDSSYAFLEFGENDKVFAEPACLNDLIDALRKAKNDLS